MNAIIEYIIKANGLLIFFCLFYRLFLQKETFYTINRWYLLGSIALSIIAPFITFTKTVFIEAPKPVIDWEQLATINSQNTFVEKNLFTFENFAIVIIGLISTILVLKTLFQLAQIYHKIKKLPYDATLQVRRSSDENIFSLYPYIVVPNHFEKFPNSEMILAHEQLHIQQKHSFDMILMQLIRSLFWMNPLLRYLQKDIEVNLEYIVDEHLQTQFDSKAYQLSLLSFQNTTPQPFVNSFNSQLKKRILQINSKKSNPMKKIKLLLAAPAIVVYFMLFQIETKAQIVKKEKISDEQTNNSVIFLLDGKKVSQEEVNQLTPDTIGSVNVTKDEEAIQKYGNEAINGVIEISTKKNNSNSTTHTFNGQYVYIVDGKEVSAEEFTKANNNNDKELTIVQNSSYAKELGYDDKDGVFILTTKKSSEIIEDKTLKVHQTHTIDLTKKSSRTQFNNENSNDISKYTLETKDEMIVSKEGNVTPNSIKKFSQLREIENKRQLNHLTDEPKIDVTVSVKVEKPSGNASEDLALFNEVFNAAKSTKEFETKNIKVSRIKADLLTDKTKYSKKITYN